MKKMKNINRGGNTYNLIIDKKVFAVTLVLWLILNFTKVQNLVLYSVNGKIYWLMKLLHFVFIYVLIYVMKKAFQNRKNEQGKHAIIIFLTYFILMMFILLLVWPGTWSWDDTLIYTSAQVYQFSPWHHFISSVFHILCMQTIPFATGIIIIQILIASLIVGYCVSKVASLITENNKKRIIAEIILFIPAILSPVVLYLLCGFRMGIYSFFELLLITRFFVIYKEKKHLSLASIFELSFLIILIASWRTEGIYYLVCYVILLLLCGREVISFKKITYSFIICTICVIGLGKINSNMIGDKDYSLTAIIEPLQALIKKSDPLKDKKELELVNQVINLDMIYENPNLKGADYFWNGIVRKNYTSEEYKNCLKGYLKLLIKYPNVALNSMWNIFYSASGLRVDNEGHSNQITMIGATLNLFDAKTSHGEVWNNAKSLFKESINENLRDKTIRFLGGIDNENKVNFSYYIFRNLFIPIALIIVCIIYTLIKKQWFMFFLAITIIARVPIVFIFSPAAYIMYYLPVYLNSYFLSSILILQIFNKKNN